MWGTVAVYLVVKLCSTLHDPMDYSPLVPLSMGFHKQEYWSGLPFPAPGDLPHPGIKPTSSALADRFFTTEPPGGYWVANLTTPTKRPEAYWNSWHGGIGGSHLTLSFCITKVSRYNSLAHPLSSSTLPLSPRGEICTCLVLSDFFFFMCSIPVSLAAFQRTFFVSLALEARVLAFQGLTGLQNQKDSSWQPTTSKTLHR